MNPGDLVFAHGKGFISWAIRFMQGIRSPKVDAHWNHVAVLDHLDADNKWVVVQAAGKGVEHAYLEDVAPGGTYEVVACPSSADPKKVVEFACSQAGEHYGFLTIASIVLNIITPKRIALRKPGTWICSALAAGALWYGGWPDVQRLADLYQCSPADLYGHIV